VQLKKRITGRSVQRLAIVGVACALPFRQASKNAARVTYNTLAAGRWPQREKLEAHVTRTARAASVFHCGTYGGIFPKRRRWKANTLHKILS
jgi:hypothetical protein